MKRALLPCLAVLAAAPSIAAPHDAFRSIDACVARLDAQVDIGYARIAARCPGLTRALETSAWSAWLPADWKRPGNALSAAGLAELHRLAARELAARPTRKAPRVERLDAVLAGLQSPHLTWGTRFMGWLRTVLGREEGAVRPGWRQGFREAGVSAALLELLARGALAVVMVLAAVILLHELQLAGLLRAPRRASASPMPPARQRSTWQDIVRAPLPEQPRLLLVLLAAVLAEQSRLPGARALTARELTQAARLADEADRRRLQEVARLAERLCFSDGRPSALEITAALEQGRELLEHLAPAGA